MGRPRKVREVAVTETSDEHVWVNDVPPELFNPVVAPPTIRSIRLTEDVPLGSSFTMTRQISTGETFLNARAELSFDDDARFIRCVIGTCVNLIPLAVVGSIYLENAK